MSHLCRCQGSFGAWRPFKLSVVCVCVCQCRIGWTPMFFFHRYLFPLYYWSTPLQNWNNPFAVLHWFSRFRSSFIIELRGSSRFGLVPKHQNNHNKADKNGYLFIYLTVTLFKLLTWTRYYIKVLILFCLATACYNLEFSLSTFIWCLPHPLLLFSPSHLLACQSAKLHAAWTFLITATSKVFNSPEQCQLDQRQHNGAGTSCSVLGLISLAPEPELPAQSKHTVSLYKLLAWLFCLYYRGQDIFHLTGTYF